MSASGESTHDLLERARGGDREALERLCGRYLGRLKRWAHGNLPPWARAGIDTDDLVQDTLMRSLGRLDRIDVRGDGAFAAYLRQALVNRIRDELRRAARRPRAAAGALDERADPEASPLEQIVGREALARYEAALARLPEAKRAAVMARIELDLPWEEVAATLELPSADAARMTVGRALVSLAREMSRG